MSKKSGGGFEDTIILCLSVLGIIFAFPFVLYKLGKVLYDDEWNGGFCMGLMVWNMVPLCLCENIHFKLWFSIFCIVAWVLIFIIQHKYDLPILSGCYAVGIWCICFNVFSVVCLIGGMIRAATIASVLML